MQQARLQHTILLDHYDSLVVSLVESRENHNRKKPIVKNMTRERIQAIPTRRAREPKGERSQLRQAAKQDSEPIGANTTFTNLLELCTPQIQVWSLENFGNYI